MVFIFNEHNVIFIFFEPRCLTCFLSLISEFFGTLNLMIPTVYFLGLLGQFISLDVFTFVSPGVSIYVWSRMSSFFVGSVNLLPMRCLWFSSTWCLSNDPDVIFYDSLIFYLVPSSFCGFLYTWWCYFLIGPFCVDKPGAPGVRGAAAARREFAPWGGAGGRAGGRCAAQRARAGAGAAQVADCQDGGLKEWVQLHITYLLNFSVKEVLGVLRRKSFISLFFGTSSSEKLLTSFHKKCCPLPSFQTLLRWCPLYTFAPNQSLPESRRISVPVNLNYDFEYFNALTIFE